MHKEFLNKCLALAQTAIEKGNHPFGALVVLEGKVVAMGVNEVCTHNDVTAHAEMRAITAAQNLLSKEELSRSILYSSTEPCAMCASAIYWTPIGHVVFGCSQEQLNSLVGGGLKLKAEEVFKNGSREVLVEDFSHDLKFQKIHVGFWESV